jgi:RNA polymerase sigma-70 factor (ECF subfamily)
MRTKDGVVTQEHSAPSVRRDAARLRDGRDQVVGGKATDAHDPLTDHSPGNGTNPVDSGAGMNPPSLREEMDFARVYETQFDFVWRSLRLLGVPPEAVEDMTQETFDIVSRQLAEFEGRSSLRTWLFGIAQRVASNYRRLVRRKLSRLEPLSEAAPSPEPTPHAHAEAKEAAGVVECFVAGLEPEWRAVFVLSLLEGLPGGEVAEALGISVNAVYCRVHTLREALRQAFEQHSTGRHREA